MRALIVIVHKMVSMKGKGWTSSGIMKTSISRRVLIAYCVISLSLIPLFTIAPVKAQSTVIGLTPFSYTAQSIGEEFSMNITITNVQDLYAWNVKITWEPGVLSLVSGPSEGPFLANVGDTEFFSSSPKNGSIDEISCTLLSNIGASGNGTLATLVFRINEETLLSPITLSNDVLLASSTGASHPKIDHQVQGATVTLGTGIRADAGGDQTVDEDNPVTLNASKTLPPGQNLTFTWAFTVRGKKVELTGMVVTYTFTHPGVYPVNLTVRDSEGRMSTDSIKVTVRDITLPVAVITIENLSLTQKIKVGQSILFSGTRSYDPKNGTIISYAWNYGDGWTDSGPSVLHVYANVGTYNVSLTVTEDGGNNNTAVITITVVKDNNPLSLFSDIGGILVAITAVTLIALPFWVDRARHRKATKVAR